MVEFNGSFINFQSGLFIMFVNPCYHMSQIMPNNENKNICLHYISGWHIQFTLHSIKSKVCATHENLIYLIRHMRLGQIFLLVDLQDFFLDLGSEGDEKK